MSEGKRETAKVLLTAVFVACAVASNVVTAKQCSAFGFEFTAGAVTFPLTYALSDIFSECYGYEWSRATCRVALLACLVSSLIFWLATALPSAPYWDGQAAFAQTLGSAPRILLASFAAYNVGDLANDIAFVRLRNHCGFWPTAILSSVVGEVFDGLAFYPIAFAGTMSVTVMASVWAAETVLKLACEGVVLPLTSIAANIIGRGAGNACQTQRGRF